MLSFELGRKPWRPRRGKLTHGMSAWATGGFAPQFFPRLEGVMRLFARIATAASLWVHLLAVNLFVARHIYFEGGTIYRGLPGAVAVPMGSDGVA